MIGVGIALAALFLALGAVACVALVLRALLTIHHRDAHTRKFIREDGLALKIEGIEIEQSRIAHELTRIAQVTEGLKAGELFSGARRRWTP